MTSLRSSLLLSLGLSVLAGGCGDPATVPDVDTGVADSGGLECDVDACLRDSGTSNDASSARDARGGECSLDGACPDAGPEVDSGTADVDSGGDVDGGSDIDTGTPSCAGIECTGYAATLATQPRGASSIENCVIQLHQTDCCGATAVYGINHAARAALCAAETTCVAGYPDPICSDDTITADTGETTTDPDEIRVRLVAGICETFVCATGPCRSEPGIAGGCGP